MVRGHHDTRIYHPFTGLSLRIQMAARIPRQTVSANRDLVVTGKFDPKDLEWLADWEVCPSRVSQCIV